jgi:hypothetical protein
MAQSTVVQLFPRAPASRALVEVADRLFAAAAPEAPLESGLKFMWQRLLRESMVSAG